MSKQYLEDRVCLRNIPKAGKKARKRKETEETAERDKTTAFSMV